MQLQKYTQNIVIFSNIVITWMNLDMQLELTNHLKY